jgi:hypothetical protein
MFREFLPEGTASIDLSVPDVIDRVARELLG